MKFAMECTTNIVDNHVTEVAGFNKQQALWSRLMLGDWKILLIINVHKLGFR